MGEWICPLTTQEVQCGYIRGQIRDGHGVDHDQFIPWVEAEFNAWLKQTRAAVWDEAYNAGVVDEATGCTDLLNRTRNPYREGAE